MLGISKQNQALCGVLLILVMFFTACSKKPDEEQIRSALGATEQAIRDRDTSATLQYLADDFVAENSHYGVMDQEQLRRLVTGIYFKHKNIHVAFTGIEIEFTDSENLYATASFRAFLAGNRGGILPDTGQAYRVSTDWRKSDGDWEITAARAKRALE